MTENGRPINPVDIAPQGTALPVPDNLISQASALHISRPDTTQEYRGHVCGAACKDIPDSGVYDASNPGLNPIVERFPGDLDG
jgi:hypothetical protein